MLMIEMEKFFEAIKNGQRSKIEEMIDREPTIVSAKNKSGATGILFALYAGLPELAELIAKRKSGLDIFEAQALDTFPMSKSSSRKTRESSVNTLPRDSRLCNLPRTSGRAMRMI